MPQIVAEPSHTHVNDVLIGDLELLLLLTEFLHELAGKVARTNAVLKPVMHRGREHVVDAPQLLQIPQTLELLGVDYVPTTSSGG